MSASEKETSGPVTMTSVTMTSLAAEEEVPLQGLVLKKRKVNGV